MVLFVAKWVHITRRTVILSGTESKPQKREADQSSNTNKSGAVNNLGEK